MRNHSVPLAQALEKVLKNGLLKTKNWLILLKRAICVILLIFVIIAPSLVINLGLIRTNCKVSQEQQEHQQEKQQEQQEQETKLTKP